MISRKTVAEIQEEEFTKMNWGKSSSGVICVWLLVYV